jgi:hypothetical protein
MIVRSVKFFWSLLVLASLTWFVFFVPLGERTLFQHVMRISQTDEARDLGREVHEAGRRVGEEVQRTVEETERERLEREARADDAEPEPADQDGD